MDEPYEATKICSKCRRLKDVTEFHRSSTNRDGRTSRCKNCRNDDSRSYAERRPRTEADAEARGASLMKSGELEELG